MGISGGETHRADVVIVTASRDALDGVLKVSAGAVPDSRWQPDIGPNDLPVVFRDFLDDMHPGERPLRVAVAQAPDAGATATTNTLLPLVMALRPSCIAMSGLCVGRPDKTNLGDVIAQSRTYYCDTGKMRGDVVQLDPVTFNLRDDWKAALEGLDVVAQFRDADWFKERPLTTAARVHRALAALGRGAAEPWNDVDPTLDPQAWKEIVALLRDRGWLAASGRELTPAGHARLDDLNFESMNKLPDLSPAGGVQPVRLHVAPIGSGTNVFDDHPAWDSIEQTARRTLGLDAEAAALGELVQRQRQLGVDAVVMKGVVAVDQGCDGHFQGFAARASAECLLWFLRTHIRTEVRPGFDDLLLPGIAPLAGAAPHSSREASPSFLLNACHVVVPWHSDEESDLLGSLDAWADDPSLAVAVRLLHGEGGVGKTRLAIQWVARRLERYDTAGFLVSNPDPRWLERLCSLGRPVLVVIDYAESRVDLLEILKRVAAFDTPAGSRRRVRLLLLARGVGDWWTGLPRRNGSLAGLLQDHSSVEMLHAIPSGQREAVFLTAARAFADRRGRAAVSQSPIPLHDACFNRVLYLHMAALAAVEGLAFDSGSLMQAILDHEERFWILGADTAAADIRRARQIVAAATLRGGLRNEDEAHTICARLAPWRRAGDEDKLLEHLQRIYHGEHQGVYLPGLQPELLGEALVLRVASPPEGIPTDEGWIERVIVRGDNPTAVTTAFTVLGRASATAPLTTRAWIAGLLRSDLAERAVLALRAAKAVGKRTSVSELGDLLATILEENGSPAIAHALELEMIPVATVSLQRVTEWQTRTLLGASSHLLSRIRALRGDVLELATRAQRLARRGVALDRLGQHDAAFAEMRDAVKLYRSLAKRDPEEFEPELATSLNALGEQLSIHGHPDVAVEDTRNAVTIHRSLAARDPDTFGPDLGMSLNRLGNRLRDMGYFKEAIDEARKAVDLYRVYATRKPDAFEPGLARCLDDLSRPLMNLGRYQEALEATREAERLYRIHATKNPDAYEPELAMSLNNTGKALTHLGQYDAALQVTQESLNLRRALTTRNPDAFAPDLAISLNSLGSVQEKLGQPAMALGATQQALEMIWPFFTRSPNRYLRTTGSVLERIRELHGTLGRDLTAPFFERQDRFVRISLPLLGLRPRSVGE